MGNTTVFRQAVEAAVRDAHDRGESFDSIMVDLSTVLGCMVAAGSPNHHTRLTYVKASMSVVETIINKGVH